MRPTYRLTEVQTALNRVQGMPFRWSLNPYRGCAHDCVYCYARPTHSYLGLGSADFAGVILVKTNVARVLRTELRRSTWQHESVAIGTATDPYQPIEGMQRITRHCLEEMADAGNPCSVTTKGTLLLRDLDVMQQLAATTGFSVHLSLVTLQPDLWRRLEPGAPPPASRLRALERLRAAGVPASVFLMPIVPGITDQPDQLRDVIRAAADHGATAVWPAPLRLAPGVKEWFLDFLRREFPPLAASYERGFRQRTNVPKAYLDRVQARVETASLGVQFAEAPKPTLPRRVGQQLRLLADDSDQPAAILPSRG